MVLDMDGDNIYDCWNRYRYGLALTVTPMIKRNIVKYGDTDDIVFMYGDGANTDLVMAFTNNKELFLNDEFRDFVKTILFFGLEDMWKMTAFISTGKCFALTSRWGASSPINAGNIEETMKKLFRQDASW